ncbi:cupin domain-containing protein [Bacillus sp. V33-4]|uniref:cupin domain-containing protein n=1 Tax=Bacillus sp. V33-4 TaxID=2054169 RepID=UPI000C77F712|nr:cupin domain-containing protein [Bacillus sp. V33-4]PLR80714.1 hypothetical protein CVD23_20355 [Bacillus sp. V33-4]
MIKCLFLYNHCSKINVKLINEVHILKEGDSVLFEANTEHCFINLSNHECHYYFVIDSHQVTYL